MIVLQKFPSWCYNSQANENGNKKVKANVTQQAGNNNFTHKN